MNVCLAVKTAAPARRLVSWFAPDIALSLALTTVLLLFFVFGGETSLFGDSDTGWHIRIGERILSTGSLPHSDPFSFSKAGEPWVAWEWGSDVVMAAVYGAGGLGGVALLYGLSIGAAVWMWLRLNRAVGGNFLFGCLFLIPMLSTTTLHWLARPHVFSWLFLLGAVWFCEQMPQRLERRHLVFAAIVAAAWANLHASFFFAPLIALLYGAGAYLRPLIWPVPDSRARNYVLLAAAAVAGTLANPYGWRLHWHLVSYLSDSALLDQINEFQSFNFHADGAVQVMIGLALCFAGGIAALAARKPERFLLSIVLTAVALRSVRALPVAVLLLLPLANGSITAVLSTAGDLAWAFRRRLDAVLNYGNSLQAIDSRFHGFAIIPLIAVLVFFSIRTRAGFPAKEAPVAASEAVALLPANARILASDTFGGYMIYRFQGERKVFFDGRSDFYGTAFVRRYVTLVETRPGWRDELKRWSFTHALLPPDYRLIPALEADGWHELYRDKTSVLLAGKR